MQANMFSSVPKKTLKIRAFGGIDQSVDENDLKESPACYTADGYNFKVDTTNLETLETSNTLITQLPAGYTVLSLYKFERLSNGAVVVDYFAQVQQTSSPTTLKMYNYSNGVWTDVTNGKALPTSRMEYITYQKGATPYCIMAGGGSIWKATGGGSGITNLSDTTFIFSKGIALFAERVWVHSGGDAVLFSDDMDPTNWTSASEQGGTITLTNFDGDFIRQIIAYNGTLLIFKGRSIWRITGTTYDTFAADMVAENIGLAHAGYACVLDGVCYFTSLNGIYAFNGTTVSPVVTAELKTLWDKWIEDPPEVQATPFYGNGALYGFNGKLYAILPQATTKSSTLCVVTYDIATQKLSISNTFTGANASTHMIQREGLPRFFVVSRGEKLWLFNSPAAIASVGTYPTSPTIAMRFAIPQNDFGTAARRKKVSKITITGYGGALTITPVVDGATKTVKTITLPASSVGVVKTTLSLTGRRVGLIIANVSGSAIKISDIEIEYNVM